VVAGDRADAGVDFAKTYADTAPHEYIVLDMCTLSRADFVRAAKVIHTFGEPGKFYSSTNIYLTDGQWKWWTMDAVLDDTNLINRATIERVYGRQDAPRTRSGHFSVYDTIATEYDDIAGPSREDRLRVQKAITGHFTGRPPHTLDVGCGTGALLDMKITTSDLYTGIDPSQGMLNALVRKHPEVKDLRPVRVQDVLSTLEPGSFDLVTALFGSASYLAPAVIEHLWRVAGRMMILMHFDVPFMFPGFMSA
jgi:hypothetical protein